MIKSLSNIFASAALILTVVSLVFFNLSDNSVISEYGFKLVPSNYEFAGGAIFAASLLLIICAAYIWLKKTKE